MSAPMEQCSASVFSGIRPSRCSRNALPGTRFCRQHDPAAQTARDAESKKKNEAQWAESLANRALDAARVALAEECIACAAALPPRLQARVEAYVSLRAARDGATRAREALGVKPW